jgi:uncharacterized protein Yka (UPF0111/DUF47 family)
MKSYEKHIDELAVEIADEIIKKENNPSYQAVLEQNRVARSLSSIHDVGLRKSTEDLDKAVSKFLRRLREE